MTRPNSPIMMTAYSAWVAMLGLATLVGWARPFSAQAARPIVELNGETGTVRSHPSVEVYDAIGSRPLFDPTRRPVLDEAAWPTRATATLPESSFTLKSTVLLDNDSIAVLADRHNDDILGVREGVMVAGWTVNEIGASWIRLSQGRRQSTLHLAGRES